MRGAGFPVCLSVRLNTVVMNAQDMVPSDDSDLLKQSHFNFF